MLPTAEHMEQTTGAPGGARELLTGDLGLVVVRALLENGVGYIVSSWHDRPTPIDAAVDEARERVLSPRGVVLRRLRSLSALEPLVTSPIGGITGAPPRGAVVFGGRRGLRPALEQFARVQCAGGVVGFSFDEDVLRIDDALVIDPEPTAIGLVRAIDAAFTASVAAGRPAILVIRERALGMRGTIRRRHDASPAATADADAVDRAAGLVSVAVAAERVGLVDASLGTARGGAVTALVVAGPIRVAAERALAQVAARLVEAGSATRLYDVAIVSSRAVGIVPSRDGAIGRMLGAVDDACVIAPRADRIAEQLRSDLSTPVSAAHSIDAGSLRGETLVSLVASWARTRLAEDDPGHAALDELAGAVAAPRAVASSRVPRRGEVLHRAVSPVVAAGLTLAQGVIGVPGRLDAAYPTYQTDTGVPLTVVPAAVFAAHGAASAAPGTGAGVFVVTGQAGGVAEAASAAGATLELVDGSSPRAIGVAIGTACRSMRVASHVIVVGDVQRIPAPRHGSTFGMDPDLVGTDRIATAAVPTAATALVQLGEELVAGPTVLALDVPAAHASLDPVRELSPATWDLRRRDTTGRFARMSWNVRRRLVRATAGVDL